MRVLARLAHTIDLTTLQAAVASLRANVDAILDARVPKSEAKSTKLAEDKVLAVLFTTSTIPPPPPRERAKRFGVGGREERLFYRLGGPTDEGA